MVGHGRGGGAPPSSLSLSTPFLQSRARSAASLPPAHPVRATQAGRVLPDGHPVAGLALPSGSEAWAPAAVFPNGWGVGGEGGGAPSPARPARLAAWVRPPAWVPGRAASVRAGESASLGSLRRWAVGGVGVAVALLNLAIGC